MLDLCARAGFARAGVCAAHPTEHADHIRAWLGAGKHGEMSYLADQLAERLDPNLVVPGVKSVVMVADRYASRNDPTDRTDPGVGRLARYARGRDYHTVIKRRLHALADTLRAELGVGLDDPDTVFRSFVDTAPVLEREYAARCGLGWVGKHTLIIDPALGSYLLLGGIYTTLELPPPKTQRAVADHCGTCTRCIDACPTGAITPYSVNGSRCLSYTTLEHRSSIADDLMARTGDWLAGCDICQEVCPHNSPRPTGAPGSEVVLPAYAPRRVGLPLLEVLNWDESHRRTALETSALKRVSLEMFKRNAAIAAGNALRAGKLPRHLADALSERLNDIAGDATEPEVVRVAAGWATRQQQA